MKIEKIGENRYTCNDLEYEIVKSSANLYFLNCLGSSNSKIFRDFNIKDKYKFVSDIVGYKATRGDFPEVKTKEDVIKVIDALNGKLEISEKQKVKPKITKISLKELIAEQENNKVTVIVKGKNIKLNLKFKK